MSAAATGFVVWLTFAAIFLSVVATAWPYRLASYLPLRKLEWAAVEALLLEQGDAWFADLHDRETGKPFKLKHPVGIEIWVANGPSWIDVAWDGRKKTPPTLWRYRIWRAAKPLVKVNACKPADTMALLTKLREAQR